MESEGKERLGTIKLIHKFSDPSRLRTATQQLTFRTLYLKPLSVWLSVFRFSFLQFLWPSVIQFQLRLSLSEKTTAGLLFRVRSTDDKVGRCLTDRYGMLTRCVSLSIDRPQVLVDVDDEDVRLQRQGGCLQCAVADPGLVNGWDQVRAPHAWGSIEARRRRRGDLGAERGPRNFFFEFKYQVFDSGPLFQFN